MNRALSHLVYGLLLIYFSFSSVDRPLIGVASHFLTSLDTNGLQLNRLLLFIHDTLHLVVLSGAIAAVGSEVHALRTPIGVRRDHGMLFDERRLLSTEDVVAVDPLHLLR